MANVSPRLTALRIYSAPIATGPSFMSDHTSSRTQHDFVHDWLTPVTLEDIHATSDPVLLLPSGPLTCRPLFAPPPTATLSRAVALLATVTALSKSARSAALPPPVLPWSAEEHASNARHTNSQLLMLEAMLIEATINIYAIYYSTW